MSKILVSLLFQQVYDVYDPKLYTKPKDQFTDEEIIFVDEDLIQ